MQADSDNETAACQRPGAEEIGGCVSGTLVATALPYIFAMGLGLGVGALVGWSISYLMLGRARSPARAAPVIASSPKAPPGDRWITARYDGACSNCATAITAGDRVLHRPRHTRCAGCG